MARTDRIAHTINTAVVLVGLISVCATIWLGLYIAGRGPIPPKQLTAEYIGPIDPLTDLKNTGTNISVSVSNGEQALPRIYIYHTSLTNTGNAPILPSDFFSDIKLSALPNWHIIAVGASPWRGSQSVSVDWKRISDNLYSSSPTLLNSGDEIALSVYLTTSEDVEKAVLLKRDATPIAWEARVSNLPTITVKPDFMTKVQQSGGGLLVNIQGWGVWFFLWIFGLYFALHLFLLRRLALGSKLNFGFFILIFSAAFLSISAADATTTYVFGLYGGIIDVPVDEWVNIPPLVLNFALIVILYLAPILKPRSVRSRP